MSQLHELNTVNTLLVDGDMMVRNSLSLAFKISKSFLKTAKTGEEGLSDLKIRHFDIILFDSNLPDMNGLDFSRKAKEIQPSALHVITPCWWNEKLKEDAIAIGINDIVEKPFSIQTLAGILLSLVGRRPKLNIKACESTIFAHQADMIREVYTLKRNSVTDRRAI